MPLERDQDRRNILFITILVTFILASVVVTMRIWTRTKIAGKIGWDDFLVVVGMVSILTRHEYHSISQRCPDVRYRVDSPVYQGHTCRYGKAYHFSCASTAYSNRTLVVHCSVYRRCLINLRSAFSCFLVDADLWDHQILEMGIKVRDFLHYCNQYLNPCICLAGVPSNPEVMEPNAQWKLLD